MMFPILPTWLRLALAALVPVIPSAQILAESAPGNPAWDWPTLTNTARPWAYWHWMGNAVSSNDLTRELRLFQQAGLGGMHVVPIYGAKGYESQYVDYLSPRWLGLWAHALAEARRLGLDLDMTLGTGWNFGGSDVSERHANARVVSKVFTVAAGGRLTNQFNSSSVQALVAFGDKGRAVELTGRIRDDGTVDWIAPEGAWRVYAVSQRPSGNKVDRPAPGQEGPMINPFFGEAVDHYLRRFTRAFADDAAWMPRAFYHDSYEYVSDWSPDLLAEFERRRGYRLQTHLPQLFSSSRDDLAARVRGDYWETISDLMVERFMPPWVGWAHAHGALTRNQAHGSPAHLLDLYAAADIPETEMFNKDRDPLVAKFASSAAHPTGGRLVAAETGTWLAEHFHVTLAALKGLVDEMFVSGVNHILYHGTTYSPADAPWPGWLFYASTQMNPRNALWRDVPAFNAYVARCQSILQGGQSDHDLLLYWPIHDLWHAQTTLARGFTVHRTTWLTGQPLGPLARQLWHQGFTFDYLSDRQLARATAANGQIHLPGGSYRAVVIPACRLMPLPTLRRLIELAEQGATILFQDKLPEDVPGLGALAERRAELARVLGAVTLANKSDAGFREARLGQGVIRVGSVEPALAQSGVARETLVDHAGLSFVRRRTEAGWDYFVANLGKEPVERWFSLAVRAQSVIVMNPLTGEAGLGASQPDADQRTRVFLQLGPGHSLIVRAFEDQRVQAPEWVYGRSAGQPIALTGKWQLEFIDGGPALPLPCETRELASWTKSGDTEAERFAGTARYRIEFDAPEAVAEGFRLDLGRVCHSARVRLNGQLLGTLFAPPFQVALPGLRPTGNALEVEVTNLSANRIRDLDRRGVVWRRFHNINFVNIQYKPFDASQWPVQDSGLLGPVQLLPVERIPARQIRRLSERQE